MEEQCRGEFCSASSVFDVQRLYPVKHARLAAGIGKVFGLLQCGRAPQKAKRFEQATTTASVPTCNASGEAAKV